MVALSAEYIEEVRQGLLESTGDTQEFNRVAQEFLAKSGVNLTDKPGDHTTPTLSSITGKVTYELDTTTMDDYEELKVKASDAQAVWEGIGIEKRRQFFETMHDDVLPQYREQFSLAISLDTAKTISDAAGEFDKGREYYGWAASKQVARELSPKMLVTDQLGRKFAKTEQRQYVIREQNGAVSVFDELPEDVGQLHFQVIPAPEPLKLIGSMAPSNYAWALEAADESARVAGGVLMSKPPSKAPSVIHMLAETEKEALDLMVERGVIDAQQGEVLKEGLHTIITGREVTEDWFKEIDVLRTVTSVSNGRRFDEKRTKAGHLPLNTILELGGNNVVAIMPSIEDPAEAAEGALRESWKNTGERCTKPGRLFIHEDSFAQCEQRMRDVHEQVWADPLAAGVGHPLDRDTKFGPLLNKGAYETMQTYLEAAREAGATVVGGERITSKEYQGHDYLDKGYYTIPPMVLWHSQEQKEAIPEEAKQLMHDKEVFAHVINVDVIDSVAQAVEKTTRSKEHLSSGFHGSNEEFAEYSDSLREAKGHPGSLYHNGLPKDGAPTLVHSGSGDGGRGDTGGLCGFVHYTRPSAEGSTGTTVKKNRASFVAELDRLQEEGVQFAI